MIQFLFFKQKTAYEMRISDWSADVCSSDLPTQPPYIDRPTTRRPLRSCSPCVLDQGTNSTSTPTCDSNDAPDGRNVVQEVRSDAAPDTRSAAGPRGQARRAAHQTDRVSQHAGQRR